MKATEMFVMVAVVLLVFALIARFISPSSVGVSITWGGTGYGTSAQFHLRRASDHVVLRCQHLLALDVALQPHCYVVAFFADNHRHRRVLAGVLSGAQLTNGSVGRLRSSSSYSPHPDNCCLESHSSNHQNAATTQLTLSGHSTTLRFPFAICRAAECYRFFNNCHRPLADLGRTTG